MEPRKFWIKSPALLYGLSVLLGTLFVLQSPLALLPFLFLLDKRHVGKAVVCFLLPIVYLYQVYTFPSSGSLVSGRLHIHSVRDNHGFTKGWSYRGMLKTQEGRLNCFIHSKKHYQANHDYQITGTVHALNGCAYALNAFSWQPIKGSFSLAEKRYQAKKWVHAYIRKHIKQRRAAHFLTGMVTGALEDRVMLQEFGNLGLSHIMAISGFHFALLTLAFHLLLRLFVPHKLEALLLIVLLTGYLLFIGDSPSIQRAWIAVMIFLLGQLFERPPQPLNSLGVALLVALILNPLSAMTLSFQLSFLATAGILLLYTPFNDLLQLWLPKRPLKKVVAYPLIWQHVYLISALIREALTLTLAVHLALLPLLLHYFHMISLNSMIYNLFFPFCASVALLLFLFGILTGGLIHPFTGWYCEHLLTLTESPPLLFREFYSESIPSLLIVIYLTCLFVFSIFYNRMITE